MTTDLQQQAVKRYMDGLERQRQLFMSGAVMRTKFATVARNGVQIIAEPEPDTTVSRWALEVDPETHVPKPDPDGRVRFWGVNPMSLERRWSKKENAIRVAREEAALAYGPLDTPEVQLVTKLANRRLREIEGSSKTEARRALYAKSYIVKIALDGMDPPITRVVRVPAATHLRTLMDKVVEPAMGWCRIYHCAYFMDFRDGACYGAQTSHGTDEMFRTCHGYVWVDDKAVRLADLLDAPGQELAFVYDLGTRWEHTLTLLRIDDSVPEGERALDVLEGEGACPPEDSNGSQVHFDGMWYSASMRRDQMSSERHAVSVDCLFLEKNGNEMYAAALRPGGVLVDKKNRGYARAHDDIAQCASNYKAPYHQRALENGRFSPRVFDVQEARERVAMNLNSMLSSGCYHGCPCCSDIVPDKNLKKLDLCAACGAAGTPDVKLKTCGACKAVRYCTIACQKTHWATHKKNCARLKEEMAAATAKSTTP